ncbi:DNA polymerase III subunit beta [Photobacterium kishitanii]|uniref:DNA polymerase III subunit beta n=1 Tax=Photobacterium kishitanii TaxID=318456 RepID=UPI0007F88551|nr:DNA polymerase III subunit beta [Photobacterium kishitanii]OBU31185.1 DNA polymerase III subunit beta [Photobacterium kishitanii]PSW46906.1 DNA polymerase III subunit beta [Photobacterium kishitanii]
MNTSNNDTTFVPKRRTAIKVDKVAAVIAPAISPVDEKPVEVVQLPTPPNTKNIVNKTSQSKKPRNKPLNIGSFKVKQSDIAPMVARVNQGVNSKKTKVAVDACLLMSITKSGNLNLVGSDREIEIISRTKVTIISGFTKTEKLAVQADRLNKLLSSFNKNDELEFKIAKNPKVSDGAYHLALQIKSGKSQYSLSLFDPENYPSLKMSSESVTFKITNNNLLWALQRTLVTSAHQDVRYYLNGVYLELQPQDNYIRVVGTDGHRLGTATTEAIFDTKQKSIPVNSVILPRTSITKINSLIGVDGDCQVIVTNQLLRIATPFVVVTSRLIDGRYPDWRRVVPDVEKNSDYIKCSLIRSDTKQVVSRCALMANEKTTALNFAFNSAKELKISATNTTDENGIESILYTASKVSKANLSLNAAYVHDALNQFDGYDDTIDIYVSDSETAPVVVKHDANATLTYVVMPLRG